MSDMKCNLRSACCDCEGRGCGCSGCVSCQLCTSCYNGDVYCNIKKQWYTPVCDYDENTVKQTYTTSEGILVYLYD